MPTDPHPPARLRRRGDSGAPRRIRWPEQRRLDQSELLRARAVLGLAGSEPWESVETAYRSLARRHHPDSPSGSAELMVELNAAYALLRAHYHPTDIRDERASESARRAASPAAPPRKGPDHG